MAKNVFILAPEVGVVLSNLHVDAPGLLKGGSLHPETLNLHTPLSPAGSLHKKARESSCRREFAQLDKQEIFNSGATERKRFNAVWLEK